MPKGKIEATKGEKRYRTAVRLKNKIGGRKSVRSVAQMSVNDLEKTVSSGRGRDKVKALRELVRRGLPLVKDQAIEVAEA